MKKEREFLNELYSNQIEKIPYLDYFRNDKYLRKKLFAEYLLTEKKVDLNLFLSNYYSDNEWNKGFIEIHENLPRIESRSLSDVTIPCATFRQKTEFEKNISVLKDKFNHLVSEKELPEKYFSHSIIKTNISEKLKFVSQKIEDFKIFVLSENFNNADKYAPIFADNIIKNLDGIGIPKLKNKVLNEFLNNQTNFNLDIAFHFKTLSTNESISKKEIERRYSELKMFADAYIRNYLEALPVQPKEMEDGIEFEKIIFEISKSENKFNKGIPMQVVIDHFKVFITSKNKNDEYYLTGDQLISFLKRCFLKDNNEPVQKINYTSGEKGDVIKRFYQFYDMACSQYFVNNPKKPFIDCFLNGFEFGERSSFESYFKGNKSNKQW
jgi:hypothetical protein